MSDPQDLDAVLEEIETTLATHLPGGEYERTLSQFDRLAAVASASAEWVKNHEGLDGLPCACIICKPLAALTAKGE